MESYEMLGWLAGVLLSLPCTSTLLRTGKLFKIAFQRVAVNPQYCQRMLSGTLSSCSGIIRVVGSLASGCTVFGRPSLCLMSERGLCVALLAPLGPLGQRNRPKNRRWLVCISTEAIRYPNKQEDACGFQSTYGAEQSGVRGMKRHKQYTLASVASLARPAAKMLARRTLIP